MKVDIKETNWGVANTYKTNEGFKIEMNEHLQEFPILREKILKHELEHTRQKSFIGQRKVDALTEIKFKDLLPFFKKYPKTALQQYSPITYRKKTLFIEWTLLILYGLGIGFVWGLIKIIKYFSTDKAFFWKVIFNMAWIFLVVGIVYYGGKLLIKNLNKESKKLTTKK